jgi:glutamine amidotransferase
MPDQPLDVAIVDHSLGNLYSVKHACEHVGLHAEITSSTETVANARAAIVPGVGAFGDAMATLHRRDLVSVLRDFAAAGKPLIGVCLGVQLLMTESFEFGHHHGLDLIAGQVVPFDHPREGERALKVPQIGWNRVCRAGQARWDAAGSLLNGIDDGEYMYFVHSYIVQPQNPDVILSTSRYGQIDFCSSVQRGNVFACQFHPERSSGAGLHMYRNLATLIKPTAQGEKV